MQRYTSTLNIYDRLLKYFPAELARIILEYYEPRVDYILCTFIYSTDTSIDGYMVSATIKSSSSTEEALRKVLETPQALGVLILYPKSYTSLGIKHNGDNVRYNDLSIENKRDIWQQIYDKYYNNPVLFIDIVNRANLNAYKIMIYDEVTYGKVFPALIQPGTSMCYQTL